MLMVLIMMLLLIHRCPLLLFLLTIRRRFFKYQHILYIRTTIKMTAAVDLCSSYDSVSTTDLSVGTTTTTDTDCVTSSCDPDDALY